ncbi:MAG: hypothetical protein VKL60_12220 [Sphaerospermopsis sp.]|uniref:Uncharacterized protein n=1 Tax=Sphaerospermopsis reniformis TaxID=531300 RepID=A0A479ZUP3_9CYAN|nr:MULTISPECIES: hypothetical protein [Sphaerospermopsis]MBC5794170.1 hypothetical protein [Sphaerospermopsis sp. LEGE 00249]MEB3149775.1 hypothetical protein [Sphaerospermopsis sp.]GCL35213.1 hypothetical protein SR1949_03050 [Sphaerospermopsis reniformis]
MAEANHTSSTRPPKKHRDPNLIARSKDELKRQQEDYIRETMKTSALKSLRQGKMQPSPVRVGKKCKIQLDDLQMRLQVDEKTILNMAFAYGYHESMQNQIKIQHLRKKVEDMIIDEETLMFEVNECTLDTLLKSGIEDAIFIYLNLGIILLHSRLIELETSAIF